MKVVGFSYSNADEGYTNFTTSLTFARIQYHFAVNIIWYLWALLRVLLKCQMLIVIMGLLNHCLNRKLRKTLFPTSSVKDKAVSFVGYLILINFLRVYG